jgi:hypothetical protein
MYIYKIYHNKALLYIGCTKNHYLSRLSTHKTQIQKHSKSSKLYTYLSDNHISYDDLYIQIIQTNITSVNHLFHYESSLIRTLKPLCNVSYPPEPTYPFNIPVSHISFKYVYPKKLTNIAIAAVLTSALSPHRNFNQMLFYTFYNLLPTSTQRSPGRPKQNTWQITWTYSQKIWTTQKRHPTLQSHQIQCSAPWQTQWTC